MMTKTVVEKVDSHQHYWLLERNDYGWLTPAVTALYQDFLPKELAPLRQAHKVTQTVVVQAAPTLAETEYLLSLAAIEPSIAGVVGWVDFDADDVIATLDKLAENHYFKGVRPMLQDIEDTAWIANPNYAAIFTKLAELGLTFDALVKPEHLPYLYDIARQTPDLAIVIDHFAKPNVAQGQFEDWAASMMRFSALQNVWVKCSGITTEASTSQTSASDYQRYFNTLVNAFGHGRIMWGSDWPVVNLNSDYTSWVTLCQTLVSDWSASEQEAFWAGTAQAFYRTLDK
ncbi:amidohydrolase [Thalassotalea euphylliae]|uniref:Amidohydrolase n=1 Tax=Thalassotalea euphylliae TaxID=1655234 RepID=A0A3E0TS23_9GAMM|nr:amidohydrolase family protein [Thalassotalea euphylliae]REL27441.1 amidohydrolase [Thalassotalea euphylliae]